MSVVGYAGLLALGRYRRHFVSVLITVLRSVQVGEMTPLGGMNLTGTLPTTMVNVNSALFISA